MRSSLSNGKDRGKTKRLHRNTVDCTAHLTPQKNSKQPKEECQQTATINLLEVPVLYNCEKFRDNLLGKHRVVRNLYNSFANCLDLSTSRNPETLYSSNISI
ncbi:hypothetical protein DM860_001389 [Cuscuta australis]|uniref:Uncharacterized protein n=1 Tax=Cuscuta australis TaxID=267555 RepID=A0A328ECM3_9ASTE|nr:hypothetical protein DM860_001389 [Cuscuta australis]